MKNVPRALKANTLFQRKCEKPNTTMIFTTARRKDRKAPLQFPLATQGFQVWLVDDVQTLSGIGVEGMLEYYPTIFCLLRTANV
mmetsp:Transcript_37292/g.63480  ORF Transcript_37292/g.63480 Transcript_37292/m.63480 type:complete len:84 (+) Transcript_37292:409-660(+)